MRLRITISGQTGSGKTTIAVLIARTLRENGFNVLECDFDIVANLHMPELLAVRLAALAPITPIDIVTEQEPKTWL